MNFEIQYGTLQSFNKNCINSRELELYCIQITWFGLVHRGYSVILAWKICVRTNVERFIAHVDITYRQTGQTLNAPKQPVIGFCR